MFNFNFQSTAAAATNTSFVPTDAGSGVVTTTIPTVMMKMFGIDTFALTANCSAEYPLLASLPTASGRRQIGSR